MLNEKILSLIKNADGDYILNWEFNNRQMVFLIKDGKFTIEDVDGCMWKFDKFEQACYFAVSVNMDHKGKWEMDWDKRYKRNYDEALQL